MCRPLHALLTAIALALCACPGDGDAGEVGCVQFDVEGCAPTFTPAYADVFTQVIEPRCGTAGTACHAQSDAAGAGGGLVISGADETYDTLLGGEFVVPGDSSCSPFAGRVNTSDADFLMPPGAQPLPEGLRCSVSQWIAMGAER